MPRWLLIATGVVVAVVLVTVGIAVISHKGEPRTGAAATDWQPPPQLLLTASMNREPTPGWHATVSDLGVASTVGHTPGQTKFATNVSPFDSSTFIGNIGDRAYFVVGDPSSPTPVWTLVGVDVHVGRPLFPAVPLSSSERPPDCYLNGPATLLCVANETENVTAWVVDAHSGAVTYTGATDLRTYTGILGVRQVGIYAVAATQSGGVYGIGSRAETTWFVPGSGKIDQTYAGVREFPSSALASQGSAGGSDSRITFSLEDGAVIRPEISAGATQTRTVIYPGGFAAEIADSAGRSNVQFFDAAGKRVGQEVPAGVLSAESLDLPIVGSPQGGWAAYSAAGEKLLQQSGPAPSQALLIGTTLFVMGDPGWHQFDLRTGAKGKDCAYGLGEGGYLGSDGKVAVLTDGNATVGLETSGADLASCATLWTLTSPPGSFRRVWRINTTLVQLSDDGTELMSLVAPG